MKRVSVPSLPASTRATMRFKEFFDAAHTWSRVRPADLASARINPEPGQGARLQSADMTRPCAGRGEAEHVVDPVRLAPVEYFRASVVAVGADEDRHLRPVAADRPHQAAEEGADFDALRP